MVPGPCEGSYFHYGYNSERGICEQFKYGGCLGKIITTEHPMYCKFLQEITTSSRQSRSVMKCVLKMTSSWCWRTSASSRSSRDHGEKTQTFVIPFSVQGISLAMDMTKRPRLVRNSTMVDVKVIIVIYKWHICLLTFELFSSSEIRFSLNYPGNFNSFMSMSECENSCKDGGSSRAMCLLPRWEHQKNKDLQFSSGPRDPVRIGFQSGTLTTLRNAACLSTTEGVKVEENLWLRF